MLFFVSGGVNHAVTVFAGSLGALSSSSTLGLSNAAADQHNVVTWQVMFYLVATCAMCFYFSFFSLLNSSCIIGSWYSMFILAKDD